MCYNLKEIEEEKQNSKLVEGNSRAEINEIDIYKTIEKINETKNWLFEKMSKIDNLLARLIKKIGRELKSIKLEMKMKQLQQKQQKYKGS